MALINKTTGKNKINHLEEIKANDIKIKDDVQIDYGEKKYSAKERKPVQVDPPVLKMIGSLSYAKDMPMYKVVEMALKAYIETLPNNEKKLFEFKQNKR
ncbi:type III secretion system protein PrgO [Weissella paramesenteroides]|uniref:DNA segregation protein PrgO n=1 Tax=Weissella paramesenteroides TaxID=1249 RepID=UPI002402A16C|nr:DNA segregation protein PrgO [Weissella paramesenteroides]MDF8367865.1 type III secretion system protein PrgO [Weissella paramesenteroides]